jgi:nucleoside-diphosphate-sugar epimerase
MEKIKKVLVTGNEGYIGCVLTETLIKRGYEVTGLDLGIFKDIQFIPKEIKPHHQIYKDIRDIKRQDLKGIDAVIHLAALCNDPLGNLNPEATIEINYKASVNLAKLAKIEGVKRFLFASSCSMYGISKQEFVTEEADLNPQTPYAESKILAEKEISQLADDKFSPIFLRQATVFGVSPRMRLDLVVQNLVAYGYLFGVITILSDGTPWRPLIHIQDVADAFCLLLEVPRELIHNQAFNVGHKDNNVQIKTIAKMVQSMIPNSKIEIKNETPSDKRSYKVDFSKIYSLGFKPKFTVLDGIKEIYKTFQEVNFNKNDFESDKYFTLKRYQKMITLGIMDKNLRLIKQNDK